MNEQKEAAIKARGILQTALETAPQDGQQDTKTNILLSGLIRAIIALLPSE